MPDGSFVAWLAQAQWARRLPSLWGVSFVRRGDVQIADRRLLGLEPLAVGGHASVRG
jgi:hemolysin activation/secretion protein